MPKVRRKLVVGNWKLNGSFACNKTLLGEVRASGCVEGVDIAVCPPFPYLQQAGDILSGSGVMLGAQDVSAYQEGAYTGEVSGRMLVDLGCGYAIVGHSERRSLFGETDSRVASKVGAALAAGLTPIVCVGESRSQRELGGAEQIVAAQLESIVAAIDIKLLDRLVVAYEPVWAIGTGLTATPEQAQSMHVFIRQCLGRAGVDSGGVRILYGGSVNAGNAVQLFNEKDIDGALVGGASLVFDGFNAICEAASKASL